MDKFSQKYKDVIIESKRRVLKDLDIDVDSLDLDQTEFSIPEINVLRRFSVKPSFISFTFNKRTGDKEKEIFKIPREDGFSYVLINYKTDGIVDKGGTIFSKIIKKDMNPTRELLNFLKISYGLSSQKDYDEQIKKEEI